MASWYETRVDRQLREAAERGEFDGLPGMGKPLPNRGEEFDGEWWIKGLIRRESLAGALPPALALRKEIEALPAKLARKHTESAVRTVVADLNDRIMLARRGPVDGPPVAISPLDADAVVRAWRAARTPAASPAPRPSTTDSTAASTGSVATSGSQSRRPWWRRRSA